ncbi:cytochrome b-c1 complex subunit 10-like [Arctopsyche grandis]|uniref:cytochrome b-c1 complex subunit 10-like n=1 Tax=Arctopsyche grandis TaxID=121162 RepID=UPI00406DA234
MSLMNKMGPRQLQLMAGWSKTVATFGATTAIGFIYFSDWRVIASHIPFYGGKFKPVEE